jgi:hypothetical protein
MVIKYLKFNKKNWRLMIQMIILINHAMFAIHLIIFMSYFYVINAKIRVVMSIVTQN